MTLYEVFIATKNKKGTLLFDYTSRNASLGEALTWAEKAYANGLITNSDNCRTCNDSGFFKNGDSALYHEFKMVKKNICQT